MKKLFFRSIAIFALVTLLISCSKDDNNPSIVGKWKSTKQGVLVNNTIEWTDVTVNPCGEGFVNILSNNTFNTSNYYDFGTGCQEINTSGTWSQDGNIITINSTHSDGTIESQKIKSYSLTNSVWVIENINQNTLESTGEYTQLNKI